MCPKTPATRRCKLFAADGQVSAVRLAELKQKILANRFCELEEFACFVLFTFLAHSFKGFIVGDVVNLNGGLKFDLCETHHECD